MVVSNNFLSVWRVSGELMMVSVLSAPIQENTWISLARHRLSPATDEPSSTGVKKKLSTQPCPEYDVDHDSCRSC